MWIMILFNRRKHKREIAQLRDVWCKTNDRLKNIADMSCIECWVNNVDLTSKEERMNRTNT